MKANEILSMKATEVDTKVANIFFNFFCKHFNVNEIEKSLAKKNFESLRKMDITLDLALNTSIALARM